MKSRNLLFLLNRKSPLQAITYQICWLLQELYAYYLLVHASYHLAHTSRSACGARLLGLASHGNYLENVSIHTILLPANSNPRTQAPISRILHTLLNSVATLLLPRTATRFAMPIPMEYGSGKSRLLHRFYALYRPNRWDRDY